MPLSLHLSQSDSIGGEGKSMEMAELGCDLVSLQCKVTGLTKEAYIILSQLMWPRNSYYTTSIDIGVEPVCIITTTYDNLAICIYRSASTCNTKDKSKQLCTYFPS